MKKYIGLMVYTNDGELVIHEIPVKNEFEMIYRKVEWDDEDEEVKVEHLFNLNRDQLVELKAKLEMLIEHTPTFE